MVICVTLLSDTWGMYSCSWIITYNLIPWAKDYAYSQWVFNFSLINIKLIQTAENFTKDYDFYRNVYQYYLISVFTLVLGLFKKRQKGVNNNSAHTFWGFNFIELMQLIGV